MARAEFSHRGALVVVAGTTNQIAAVRLALEAAGGPVHESPADLCTVVKSNVLHYDLTADRRGRIQATLEHLGRCADCRAAVRNYDKGRELLQGKGVAE